MNKVLMMGRLTRDPEERNTQNGGMTIARFSIAVDRRFKREGEPEADFFNCTAFGKQAEFVMRYLRKGVKVVVIGRIQNDNYTAKDGTKTYSVQIMVDEIEFAESKNAAGANDAGAGVSGFNGGGNGYSGYSRPSAPSQPASDGFMNLPDGVEDEGLPFN